MSNAIPFRKMNGLGNAILLIDMRDSVRQFTAAETREIAARPETRFEQMMVLYAARAAGSQAYVRIYNCDGSEVEACGNGMRCLGWMVAQEVGRQDLRFETKAGLLDVVVAGMDRVSVDMGTPRFGWADIPLAEPMDDTRRIALQYGTIDQPLLHSPSVVNVGNPHAIFWVGDVHAYDLGRIGPLLENHPMFPERANISLAQVTSQTAITLRTWERGAGLTRACGSAACASVVCAARNGLTQRRATTTLPGGRLEVEWRADDHIVMTGPVAVEREGVLELLGTA
jgi:diaminopimelate epimerase